MENESSGQCWEVMVDGRVINRECKQPLAELYSNTFNRTVQSNVAKVYESTYYLTPVQSR